MESVKRSIILVDLFISVLRKTTVEFITCNTTQVFNRKLVTIQHLDSLVDALLATEVESNAKN